LQHERRQQVKGPASYFLHRENTGSPLHWLNLLAGITDHMELVAWLKDERGMGHGHANALVAHHWRLKSEGRAAMNFTHRPVTADDVNTLCSFPQGVQELFFMFPKAQLPADGRTNAHRDQPTLRLHGVSGQR
jgi:hypothetical protein